jgi:hypothetical protein
LSDFTFANNTGITSDFERTFSVYYKGVQLHERYSFSLHKSNDGELNLSSYGIWERMTFANANNLNLEPFISLDEVVRISNEYSEGLPIENTREQFPVYGVFTSNNIESSEIVMIIYCLDELKVTYRTQDWNDRSASPLLISVHLSVYINIMTGDVISHVFNVNVGRGNPW